MDLTPLNTLLKPNEKFTEEILFTNERQLTHKSTYDRNVGTRLKYT